ncbi:MAG: hypothetical protein EA404_15245 [Spirochaetaceae bacterium]|nr:MAG: hypothetical protein EA404_15245 [Spirochaetaceae bacterium]
MELFLQRRQRFTVTVASVCIVVRARGSASAARLIARCGQRDRQQPQLRQRCMLKETVRVSAVLVEYATSLV